MVCGDDVVHRFGHARREPVRELELREGAQRGLLHDVRPPRSRKHDRAVDVGLTVDEDAVAGHLDVVEDDERVLFVEAHRQRMVEEVRLGSRRAVAAQEDQAGRVHRDREAQRVLGRDVRAAAGDRDRRRSRRRTAPASRGCVRRVRRCRARCRRPCATARGCRRTRCRSRWSIVGCTSVCVSERSSRASCFWNAMRLSWPSSLRAVRAQPRGSLACEPGEGDVHVVRRAPHEPD